MKGICFLYFLFWHWHLCCCAEKQMYLGTKNYVLFCFLRCGFCQINFLIWLACVRFYCQFGRATLCWVQHCKALTCVVLTCELQSKFCSIELSSSIFVFTIYCSWSYVLKLCKHLRIQRTNNLKTKSSFLAQLHLSGKQTVEVTAEKRCN